MGLVLKNQKFQNKIAKQMEMCCWGYPALTAIDHWSPAGSQRRRLSCLSPACAIWDSTPITAAAGLCEPAMALKWLVILHVWLWYSVTCTFDRYCGAFWLIKSGHSACECTHIYLFQWNCKVTWAKMRPVKVGWPCSGAAPGAQAANLFALRI